MPVTAPIVNINGTSADDLLEGYEKAFRALRELNAILREIAPHGRDYQILGGADIYERAREEHAMRLIALNKIERDIIELAQAVQDQQGKPSFRVIQ